MTKQELLQEGNILTSMMHQTYENILGRKMPSGFALDDEQRYKNWLELAQRYVFENKVYPEQYEEFKRIKDYISLEAHKSILAIINSLK